MTALNTIAPALMAGNTVVLKHASQTLLVGERFVQAFNEAGVPEDVFMNVFLDHDTTTKLIAAGSFNFINFTGSVEGGRNIERAAAGTFTGTGLELGGKDPGYVMEDADLDAAVDTLMDGATYNSGQCCCGIERIYVNENLYDAFVEKSVAWVSNYKLGNPLDKETTLGPMAHKRFAATVREQIAQAVSKAPRRWSIPSSSRRTMVAPISPRRSLSMSIIRWRSCVRRPSPGCRHHEGQERCRSARTDERLQVRSHRFALDEGRRARRPSRP